MIEGWLQQITKDFWYTLGGELPYPRMLKPTVSRSFPLSIIALPNLTVSQVENWFMHLHIPFRFLCQDRSLCGCIVAVKGRGLIFVDSLDSDDEQRYTIAHEVSHFLLDYLHPRREALQLFGETIRPVLDGERPPTSMERLDALLGGIQLGTYFDLMPRSTQGTFDQGYILRAEKKADRLALELLAPAEHVFAHIADRSIITPFDRLSFTMHLLTSVYGLPPTVAKKYSQLFRPSSHVGSTARLLGLDSSL